VAAARSAPSRGGPSATGTYFRAAEARSSLVFLGPQPLAASRFFCVFHVERATPPKVSWCARRRCATRQTSPDVVMSLASPTENATAPRPSSRPATTRPTHPGLPPGMASQAGSGEGLGRCHSGLVPFCECSTWNSMRPAGPTGAHRGPDLVPRGTVAGSEAAAIGAAPARAAVERTTHVRARAARRRGRQERGAASFGSRRRSRRGRANVAYPCDLSEQGAFCGDPGAAGVLRGTGLDLIERLVAVPRHP
jgi:hypothetical protein